MVLYECCALAVLAAQKDKFVEAIINLIGSADYILDT